MHGSIHHQVSGERVSHLGAKLGFRRRPHIDFYQYTKPVLSQRLAGADQRVGKRCMQRGRCIRAAVTHGPLGPNKTFPTTAKTRTSGSVVEALPHPYRPGPTQDQAGGPTRPFPTRVPIRCQPANSRRVRHRTLVDRRWIVDRLEHQHLRHTATSTLRKQIVRQTDDVVKQSTHACQSALQPPGLS
jgi:hypothetical protein